MCIRLFTCWFLRGFATVELRDDLGIDPVELFFGENAEERPCQIKGLEDAPGLVRALEKQCKISETFITS